MSTGTTRDTTAAIIGGACARQVQAELHHEAGTGLVTVGRIQFLKEEQDRIIARRPTYAVGDNPIPDGREVRVHFSVHRTIYQFQSMIIDGKYRFKTDSGQYVTGCTLRLPACVNRSQRRRHLRISMAGCDPITVEAVRPDPDVLTACAVNAERPCGRLVDLACGGAAVLFDRAHLNGCSRGEQFYLSFALPEEAEALCLLGSICHMRMIASSDSIRVGFGFRSWYHGELAHDQRRLARFIADLERQKLRRRK